MNDTNKKIAIFALKTLRDGVLTYPKEDLTGAHIALGFVKKIISHGVPGISEGDVTGAIYAISSVILELERDIK